MMECTHTNTPMALKSIITPSDEQHIDPTRYRQLVGSLQYLTFTRPNIVHAVNKACQHFQAPTKADLRAVKRILRYLKGTWSIESGFSSKVIFVSLVFVMLIGRDAQTQEEAHLGIVFFWELIVSHGPKSDNL